MNGLVAFPTFFNLSLNFAIRRSWSEHPSGASGKEPTCQCKLDMRCWFDPWIRKIPWRRPWQSAPVFLPRESHGQRSLERYSSWGHKETEAHNLSYSQLPFLLTVESFSIFGYKEHSQSDFSIDHLVIFMCRIVSYVVGKGCLLDQCVLLMKLC